MLVSTRFLDCGKVDLWKMVGQSTNKLIHKVKKMSKSSEFGKKVKYKHVIGKVCQNVKTVLKIDRNIEKLLKRGYIIFKL